MRLALICLTILFPLLFPAALDAASTPGGDHVLVRIDGEPHTVAEATSWWKEMRDSPHAPPPAPSRYVDWLLLVREARAMEIGTTPEFRRKTRVFLETRAIMRLKYDEIDSNIHLDDDKVRRRYERDYVPLRLVALLRSPDREALATLAAGRKDRSTTYEALRAAVEETSGVTMTEPQWLRPVTTPKDWRPLVAGLGSGAFSEVFAMRQGYGMLFVAGLQPGSADDFKKKKKAIAGAMRRDEEIRLTRKLLSRLRKKFKVQVDHELLDRLDLDSTDPALRDQPLITTTKGTVTVGYFLDQCRREKNAAHGRGDRSAAAVKKRVLDAMLANGLVSYEALDRHYEERPPLAPIYRFYQDNTMVGLLKKRITTAVPEAGEDEAREYYRQHPERFRAEARYRLFLVKGPSDTIQRIWSRVLQGRSLKEAAAAEKLTPLYSGRRWLPAGHLATADRARAARLGTGGVSGPYQSGDSTALMELKGKKMPKTPPFDQLKAAIVKQLTAERRQAAVAAYVDRLRSATTIDVDAAAWKAAFAAMRVEARPGGGDKAGPHSRQP